MIQFLDWDSNFLGYKVGKAEPASEEDLVKLAEEARKGQYRLIYVFVENSLKFVSEACLAKGWFLADKKQTYLRLSGEEGSEFLKNIVEVKEVSPELTDLALQSGVYSRFKVDSNFNQKTYEGLYKTWIERSVKREIAEQVWGYYHGGQLAGMLTFGIKNGRADIGLLAVGDNFRGLGIGATLVKKAVNYAFESNIKEIQVVTQGDNSPAVSLYNKGGFSLESQINIFHLWL